MAPLIEFTETTLLSYFLVGAGIWAVLGIIRRLTRLPRYDPDISRWRDPSTGQFVSAGAAITAGLSFWFSFLFLLLSKAGVSQFAIDFGQMVVGYVTSNFDLSAALSVLFFVIGYFSNR